MIINGEKEELEEMTVNKLIEKFELNIDHVVIEVNELIIDKSLYDNTRLDKNSRVEIIAFVGGG